MFSASSQLHSDSSVSAAALHCLRKTRQLLVLAEGMVLDSVLVPPQAALQPSPQPDVVLAPTAPPPVSNAGLSEQQQWLPVSASRGVKGIHATLLPLKLCILLEVLLSEQLRVTVSTGAGAGIGMGVVKMLSHASQVAWWRERLTEPSPRGEVPHKSASVVVAAPPVESMLKNLMRETLSLTRLLEHAPGPEVQLLEHVRLCTRHVFQEHRCGAEHTLSALLSLVHELALTRDQHGGGRSMALLCCLAAGEGGDTLTAAQVENSDTEMQHGVGLERLLPLLSAIPAFAHTGAADVGGAGGTVDAGVETLPLVLSLVEQSLTYTACSLEHLHTLPILGPLIDAPEVVSQLLRVLQRHIAATGTAEQVVGINADGGAEDDLSAMRKERTACPLSSIWILEAFARGLPFPSSPVHHYTLLRTVLPAATVLLWHRIGHSPMPALTNPVVADADAAAAAAAAVVPATTVQAGQELLALNQWAHQLATFTSGSQQDIDEQEDEAGHEAGQEIGQEGGVGGEEAEEEEEAEEQAAQRAFIRDLYSRAAAALEVWPAAGAAAFLQSLLLASASASVSTVCHLSQQRRRLCMQETVALVLGRRVGAEPADGSNSTSGSEVSGLHFVRALFRCGVHTLLHCYRSQHQPAIRRAETSLAHTKHSPNDEDDENNNEKTHVVTSTVLELLEVLVVAAPCAVGAFTECPRGDGSGSCGLGSLSLTFFKVMLSLPKHALTRGAGRRGGSEMVDKAAESGSFSHPALLQAVLWQYVAFHQALLQPTAGRAIDVSATRSTSLDGLDRGWFLYSAEKRELQHKIRSFVHALSSAQCAQSDLEQDLEQDGLVSALLLAELRKHDPSLAASVVARAAEKEEERKE
jgi:hypothetical protein